jgi:aminopeptidase N
VLAGGGTVIAEERANGQQTVTYALGPARDFYLAASDAYAVTTGAAGATTIRVYAPEAYNAAAQQTVEDAAAALEVFAARYGPYPYTELDLVTTPTYALGIEYPGIIALTNGMLDPATGDPLLLEVVTAHEVGHQWFYNLVGNDQLDDPWLDESVTQFATWQYFADTGGEDAAKGFHDSLTGRWGSIGMAEIPIGLPVADYDGPEYSAIVYGRGPLFFEALAQHMGQPAFDAFLADYARTYRWGLATPEGMRSVAEAACACELDGLFSEWGAD